MMDPYVHFQVHGRIRPHKSLSVRAFQAKNGKVFAHAYDSPENKTSRAYVRSAALQAMLGKDMIHQSPVSVTVWIYRPRPKSLKRAVLHPITRPDWDNVAKIVMDALNGVVYEDDALVVHAEFVKAFSDDESHWLDIKVDRIPVMEPPPRKRVKAEATATQATIDDLGL